MCKFISTRVVIGYGLGVVASCRSSTVVTLSPLLSSAGFLGRAVTELGACPEGDVAETLEVQATLTRLFLRRLTCSLVPVRGTRKGDSIVTFDSVIVSCFLCS